MTPFKKCSSCGTDHTLASWLALEQIGEQQFPGDPVRLVMANCTCGTTLAIELPARPVTEAMVRAAQAKRAERDAALCGIADALRATGDDAAVSKVLSLRFEEAV